MMILKISDQSVICLFLGKIIENAFFSKLMHICVKIHFMVIHNQLTDLVRAVRMPLEKYTMIFSQF